MLASPLTAPCPRCFVGCYVETPGTPGRRAYDPRTFKTGVDRFVSSCPACRGLGRVFVTPEEHAGLARLAATIAQDAFRRSRAAVCRARGLSPSWFDAAARKRLAPGDSSPTAWARAAHTIAEEFGIATQTGR
jgi:hypothetical protein